MHCCIHIVRRLLRVCCTVIYLLLYIFTNMMWSCVKWRNKRQRGMARHHLVSYPVAVGGDLFTQLLGDIARFSRAASSNKDPYQIGQLYMIARHSHEQSESGEGVEVIVNVPCEHPDHGKGQYTEKRIHLSSRLPYWIQSFLPRVFYVTEKAWNYYPYTITEYTCSFIPKFSIHIQTKFENNNGSSENCLNLTPEQLEQRTVDFIDICYDEISPRHYKEEEDLRFFQSSTTKRGPLTEGWTSTAHPIMCSYKVVQANFEVWGLQTKAEDLIQRSIREILLLGHRQAFAWVDEWYTMSLTDVRLYESEMHRQTNTKVTEDLPSVPTTPRTPPAPTTPTVASKSSWFPWQ